MNIHPSSTQFNLSSEELENLSPGCYIQIQHFDYKIWVEITEINDEMYVGNVHPELNDTQKMTNEFNDSIVKFTKNQIINLGCDNYCWC